MNNEANNGLTLAQFAERAKKDCWLHLEAQFDTIVDEFAVDSFVEDLSEFPSDETRSYGHWERRFSEFVVNVLAE